MFFDYIFQPPIIENNKVLTHRTALRDPSLEERLDTPISKTEQRDVSYELNFYCLRLLGRYI